MTVTTTPAPEIFEIDRHITRVSCDGGGGALGHPIVWYTLGNDGRAECKYCDRVFVHAGKK